MKINGEKNQQHAQCTNNRDHRLISVVDGWPVLPGGLLSSWGSGETNPTDDNTPSTCNDSTLRFKFLKDGRRMIRDCSWVGNTDTLDRCALNGVSSVCPYTCITCTNEN